MPSAPPTTDRRLIFLDFDGTLAEHGVIPPGHQETVRAARAAGHRIFLCTGRPWSMVTPEVREQFDGIVAAAGGYVVIDGNVLLDLRYPDDLAAKALDWLDRHHSAYLLEAPDALYGPPGIDRRVVEIMTRPGQPRDERHQDTSQDILSVLRMQDDLSGVSFGKITCFDSQRSMAELCEYLGPEVLLLPTSVPDLGDASGELQLTAVHKAVGMAVVVEHLGATVDDVIAAGDGRNDQEMLEYAGVAIAVEGSNPDLIAVADHVMPGPRQDGLTSIFTQLGLLEPVRSH